MQNAKYRVQSKTCRVQSAKCRIQNTECRVQNAELRLQCGTLSVAVARCGSRTAEPDRRSTPRATRDGRQGKGEGSMVSHLELALALAL